jgi:peptidoglycan/LPS O-acetylase OafA/YrhL
MSATRDSRFWQGNNFALIRVLASAQVALMHAVYFFELEPLLTPVRRVLQYFPGVPVFFFVSGLLVTRSFLSSAPADYFLNRILRIFPALWVCLIAMLAPIFLHAGCSTPSSAWNWLSWWFAQASVGQMWMPEFLSGCFQSGFNGGRWTIAVELQFYALLPLLMLSIARAARTGLVLLLLLAMASVVLQLRLASGLGTGLPRWLLAGTLPQYFWIFALGIFAQRWLERIASWFSGRVIWWLAGYVAVVALSRVFGLKATGSSIHPLNMLALCGLVLSVALSARGLADRLLRGNDFTYGLYLLHPVVFHVMAGLGFGGGVLNAVIALALACAAAAASWLLVERPFLRRKRHTALPRVVA